jgi:hypothetical protein
MLLEVVPAAAGGTHVVDSDIVAHLEIAGIFFVVERLSKFLMWVLKVSMVEEKGKEGHWEGVYSEKKDERIENDVDSEWNVPTETQNIFRYVG